MLKKVTINLFECYLKHTLHVLFILLLIAKQEVKQNQSSMVNYLWVDAGEALSTELNQLNSLLFILHDILPFLSAEHVCQ